MDQRISGSAILGIKLNFTVCEILFGFPLTGDVIFEAINYLILIGKWFLNHKKCKDSVIYFSEYKSLIKSKLEVALKVYKNNDNQLSLVLDTISISIT